MSSNGAWYLIQWLHFLALSLWIGGITFLSVVAAPAAHRSLASKAVAGDIVGRILKRLNRVEIACALILLGTGSAAFRFIQAEKSRGLVALMLTVLIMGCLTLYYSFLLTPRLESLREKIPTLDALSNTHPAKLEFDRLHRIYVQLMSANLVLSLAVLYGSVVIFQ